MKTRLTLQILSWSAIEWLNFVKLILQLFYNKNRLWYNFLYFRKVDSKENQLLCFRYMHAINSITRWSRTCDRPLIIPDQRSKTESDILYTYFYYIFSNEIPGFFFHGINVKSSHAVLFILWKYQISCKNVNPMKFLRVERNKFKIQRKCYKQKFNVWIRRIWYYIIRETVLNICKNIFKNLVSLVKYIPYSTSNH